MQPLKRASRQLMTGFFVAFVMLGCSAAETDTHQGDDIAFSDWLDAKMPHWLQTTEVPGAAIAVMEDGELTLVAGYGYANTASRESMTRDHLFNAASLSKPVTAWGVMRLVDEGVIQLDIPVNTYLDRWSLVDGAGRAEEVTVRSLLSHMAGISMPSTPGFRWPMETPDLIQVLRGEYEGSTYSESGTRVEIIHPPGDSFHYSGGGFLILQLLIEEMTGMLFQDYMKEFVLDPLGMSDSQFGWTETLSATMATPYLESGNVEDIFRLPGHAASSLHASAKDLGSWLLAGARGSASLRNQVISEFSFERMLTPVANVEPGRGDLGQMGLGYFVHTSDEILIAGHRGGNAGWRARFRLAPDAANGFVILTNSDSGNALIALVSCAWAATQEKLHDIDDCP